jgi:hypothetical protein
MSPSPSKSSTIPVAGNNILIGLINGLTIAKAGVTGIGVVPGLESVISGALHVLTMIEVR